MASLQGKEILVIDDAADARFILRKALEGDGASVTESDSAEAGILLAEARAPHLVITDLMMNGASGFDFLARRRQIPSLKDIPIIVSSGLNDKPSVMKALALGAKDYLLKPVRTSILLRKVKKALNAAPDAIYVFVEGARPEIELLIPAEIVQASETGVIIESPVRVAPGSTLSVDSELLERAQASGIPMRSSRAIGAYAGPGRYLTDLTLVGLGRDAVQRIRAVLKEWS